MAKKKPIENKKRIKSGGTSIPRSKGVEAALVVKTKKNKEKKK